ncbi:hypothetical protein Salat_1452500 [Sesamum alatum]|uniref:Uncharacterized protein n=1 Tax=Sesamum alatum TaxID=300844 RepID=A0AAE1YC26_9LAMI|nr:hypothetical protein Salat_1452500 [Sesamum alatum]
MYPWLPQDSGFRAFESREFIVTRSIILHNLEEVAVENSGIESKVVQNKKIKGNGKARAKGKRKSRVTKDDDIGYFGEVSLEDARNPERHDEIGAEVVGDLEDDARNPYTGAEVVGDSD